MNLSAYISRKLNVLILINQLTKKYEQRKHVRCEHFGLVNINPYQQKDKSMTRVLYIYPSHLYLNIRMNVLDTNTVDLKLSVSHFSKYSGVTF